MGHGNLAGDDSKLRESVALLRDRQHLFLKTIVPGNVGREADRRKQIIPRLGLTIAKSVGNSLFFFFFQDCSEDVLFFEVTSHWLVTKKV